jgi:integrase
MSTLRESLDEYLVMRRALGFHLDKLEYLAGGFIDWLAGRGQTESFTIADAVTWARLPAQADPIWWGMRLGAVRTFAAYQNARDSAVPVIPAGLLPATSNRAGPYIYAQQDLDALLAACSAVFRHGFVADTMHAIVGLLAATGMRIGEALRLAVSDITADADSGGGLLLVRASKHGADRLLPVDASTIAALAAYRDLPARRHARPAPAGPLFVTRNGTGYHRSTIEVYFQRLVRAAGLQSRGQATARLHSFRHSFTTGHIAAAYRSGTDAQRTLTLLSTWLGHTSPAHTYWYLTATPELMALAAGRLASQPAGFGEGTPQ